MIQHSTSNGGGSPGNPHALLAIAKKRKRRLSAKERVEVLVMLKCAAEVFTYRQMADLFGVSFQQIHKDMRKVKERLAVYREETRKSWQELVDEYGRQYLRVLRELWRAFGAEKRPFQQSLILHRISETNDRFLARMQDLGMVPRAPNHMDPGAVFLPLPAAAEFVHGMINAATKAGLRGHQLIAFQREALAQLRLQKFEKKLIRNGKESTEPPP